jgi:hypothetical protein
VEKSKLLEVENAELIRETQASQEELLRLQERNRKLAEQREVMQADSLPPHLLKEFFLTQLEETNRTLARVNEQMAAFAFDFRGREVEPLERFSCEFRKLEEEVLERTVREERRRETEQLHNGYKKLILRLVKDFEERENKKDLDFRRFFAAVAHRPLPEPLRSFEPKSERTRRKSKTYAEKEENTDVELMESSRQWEQSRQRVEWLELAFAREKENWRQLERTYLDRTQRLQASLNDTTN